MNNKHIRLVVSFLILGIAFSLTFGAKSCLGRSRNKTKVGSSIPPFMINAPSNLTATAVSFTMINLSWLDNSNNENGFRIERLTFPSTTFLLIATVGQDITSYLDSDLTSFTTYFYRIQAFNTIGDTSEYSNIANISTAITFSAITAGQGHTIALANDGTIWSWGLNDYYQLGIGVDSPILVTIPTQIDNDTDWLFIEPGFGYWTLATDLGDNTICGKTDATLWAWGKNYYGKLGLGYTSVYGPDVPTRIGNDTDWSLVSAGPMHTLALKNNKTLYSWGYNSWGQLGLGDSGPNTNRFTPTQMGTDLNWNKIAAGREHSLAIKDDGTLWVWGNNDFGQLGLESTIARINTPRFIGTQSDWSFITAAEATSMAIKTNGTLWSWGNNDFWQLGIGLTNIDTRDAPTSVGTASDWMSVIARNASALAIKSNGTIWSWGNNRFYNLGLGNTIGRSIPSQIGSESDWNTISFGGLSGFARKNNNTFWCWGDNSFGQLGFGDTITRNIPYQFGSPLPPSALRLTVASDSQINLSWNDNSLNELGFIIERRTESIGYSFLAVVGSNINSYADTTVSTGNIYYYRICAFSAFANSGYTSSTNEITPGLYPPSLSVMVVSPTQISLSFSDSNPDESGFQIERSTDGITWILIATTTGNTYFDNEVTQGNTYYYRIRAFNPFVNSNWSNIVNPSLDQPFASLLVINASQIDLSWTDDSPDETGFRVERKTGTGGTWEEIGTVGANVLTYSDTTVSAPTEYHYRVMAFNWFANSNWSSSVTPSLANLYYAGLLVINASQINLLWEDYNSDEAGFRIERRISPTGYSLLATVGADITSYQDTTVSPGNVYYYHVRAFNAFKNSGYSADVTPLLINPYLDTNVTGGQFSQINLSWGDNNQDESGFQIERKTGGTGTWGTICTVGVSPLSYSDTTVTYGNTYYYKIKAFNPFIGSAYSSEAQVNNILPPPVCFNSYVQVISDTIILGWIDSSSYLETGFQIERATNISTNWSTTFTVGANITLYSDTDVIPGNTYYYRVRAFNDYFYSDWSDTVHPSLSSPNDFRLNVISPILYALSWSYSNPIYLSGFEIERKISGSAYSLLATVGKDVISYYDNITSANVYYYRIRAFNAFVNSDWADEVTPTLQQPSLDLTVVSSNRIDLGWDDDWDDEEGIEIERSINNTSTWVTIFTTGPNIIIYSDTPVTPGDIYYYRIRAFNAFVNSAYSSPDKTPSLLSTFDLSIVSCSLTQIDLSWTDSSDNRDEFGFKIERKNGRNGVYEEIGTTVTAEWIINYSDITLSGFAPNKIYYYRVRAFNPFVDSEYSNEVSTAVWGDWSLVAGADHTIAIKTDKTIWTWGYNQFQQLGLGDTVQRNTPTQIGTQSDWSNVSAGWVHTIAIKTNGVIWSWGFSFAGQLGLGDYSIRNTPVQMGSESDWSSVKAGYSHTIALKTDKTLWSWGGNDVGQLGLGGTVNRNTPTQVGTQSDWKAISAGYNHILALKTTGYLWAWGKNDYGQLGLGDNTNRSTPTLIVIGQSDWSVIAAGGDLNVGHSIALKTDGTMWAWGRNNSGQLGLYWDNNDRNSPTQAGTLSDWIAISAGAQHTMGRKSNGTIWAWGRNNYGQLGNDDYGTDRNTPVPVGTQIDWQLITAGYNHTMGIKTNGLLWVWGMNEWGQLGLGDSGSTSFKDIPTMLGD